MVHRRLSNPAQRQAMGVHASQVAIGALLILPGCAAQECSALVLPLFPAEETWNRELRAALYLIGLLYCFVGVSVLSDAFMAGIERITNTTYKKKVPRLGDSGNQLKDKRGTLLFDYVDTLVWNPTVANLTLMALGSSTPEILLSMIEIAGAGFYSGDLGPGTIVGSASFNLYMITAFCMVALPAGVSRKIEGTTVFLITAFHSLFAYIWMSIVLLYISPDVVEDWEAYVTLALCPWLVIIAYCADKNWFRGPRVAPEPPEEGDEEQGTKSIALSAVAGGAIGRTESIKSKASQASGSGGSTRGTRFKKFMARILSVRTVGKYEQKSAKELEHSHLGDRGDDECVYSFSTRKYAVLEAAEVARVAVRRCGRTDIRSVVHYRTEDDTALAGKVYRAAEGVVEFDAGAAEGFIEVAMEGGAVDHTGLKFKLVLALCDGLKGRIGNIPEAEVAVSDAEGPGTLRWVEDDPAPLSSLQASVFLTVERRGGCAGEMAVLVKSRDDTALAGVHYEEVDTILDFNDGEATRGVEVKLHPFEEPGEGEARVVRFFLELGNMGEHKVDAESQRAEVRVRWDPSPVLGLEETTFGQQFRQAFAVGEDVTWEDASVRELLTHLLSFFWKVLAAGVPPPQYWGGWACFVVGLAAIGVVTWLINDLASIFGCLVGLKDQVTAITIVALGTSLPDTFASVLSIRAEDNADNAIGNITGSNSINVFLGLGLPWTAASIYWQMVGPTDAWRERYADWKLLGEWENSGAFVVIGGNLGFNTLLFTVLTIIAFSLLYLRRRYLGYELGGSKPLAWATSICFATLWIIYITVSSIQIYHPELLAIDLGYRGGYNNPL